MNWRWIQYLLAVIAALTPLLGIFIWGWQVREVILIYWFENLAIGFWQIGKILLVGGLGASQKKEPGLGHMLFTSLFFLVHYGGFCAIHGFFILVFVDGGDVLDFGGINPLMGPFVFLQILFKVVSAALIGLPTATYWSIVSLFAMRGLGVVQDFFLAGKWKEADLNKLMFEPYKKILLIHIAILVGGALVMFFQEAWPVLALIVVGKLLLDIRELRKEE